MQTNGIIFLVFLIIFAGVAAMVRMDTNKKERAAKEKEKEEEKEVL